MKKIDTQLKMILFSFVPIKNRQKLLKILFKSRVSYVKEKCYWKVIKYIKLLVLKKSLNEYKRKELCNNHSG